MSTASSKETRPAKEQAVNGSPVVPWNGWGGVGFVIVWFFISQFISGLLLVIYTTLSGWSHERATSWLNSSVSGQFFYVLLAEFILIGGLYLFLKQYKVDFKAVGLVKPRAKDPLLALLMLPLYYLIFMIMIVLIKHFVPGLNLNQTQQIGFNSVSGGLQVGMALVALVILPPLAEEIMVRGFLYGSFKKAVSPILAALLTSLLFASAHLPEGGSSGPLYVAAVDTFILSLFLIYLREKTGGLWSSISLHAFKNAIAFIALFGLNLK